MKFHSQRGEDKWIYENLDIPANGFFIDVGAADPVIESNTLFFESIEWNGICIEPDVKRKKTWEESGRKAIVHWGAIGSQHCVTKFYMRKKRNLSSLMSNKKLKKLYSKKCIKKFMHYSEITKVTVHTMDEILDLYGVDKIDLLSIDTEGTELDVMDSLTSIRPGIVIIEYKTWPIKEDSKKYLKYFTKRGYKLIYDSGLNHIYQ